MTRAEEAIGARTRAQTPGDTTRMTSRREVRIGQEGWRECDAMAMANLETAVAVRRSRLASCATLLEPLHLERVALLHLARDQRQRQRQRQRQSARRTR